MGACPGCGAATNPGATFCHACGATLSTLPMGAPPGTSRGIPPSPAAPGHAAVHPSQRARPVGVTIIGFVTIVFSAFAIVAGLFVMLFFGALGAFLGIVGLGSAGPVSGFFAALGIFLAMFVFAFAAFGIIVGVATLRGRSWAWVAMLVLMGLNALGGLSSLAQRQFSGVLTLLVSGLVVWYFFQPDVKAWFGRA